MANHFPFHCFLVYDILAVPDDANNVKEHCWPIPSTTKNWVILEDSLVRKVKSAHPMIVVINQCMCVDLFD